jgi:hypothetical protein
MSSPRFLVDENILGALPKALRQQEPGMDVLCVGEPGAPPCRTLDPDLLLAAESLGRMLISRDRDSMPGHLADHFAAGHHTWGTALLRNGFSLGRYIQEILIIWGASEADEWIDQTMYLP